MKHKNWLTDYTIAIMILIVIFFFIYSWFSLTIWLPNWQQLGHIIYSWPDAMANQAFINNFIEHSSLSMPVAQNLSVDNIIHPRSVNVFQGNLVPMGFLGILLIYGVIGKVISIAGTLFLTPFFSCLAVLFFFSLIKRIMGQRAAFISSILLLTLAGYWYYSSLVMLPTVLFVSLLIIGFWFLTKKNYQKPKLEYLNIGIGSLIIGLAVTVRTVELVWVLAACLVLLLFFGKKNWYLKALIFVVCLIMVFIPIFWQNKILYGDYLNFGYLDLQDSGSAFERLPGEFQVESNSRLGSFFKLIFIPFGFHPRVLLNNFYQYFLVIYWPYLIFALAGGIYFLAKKKKDKKLSAYLIIVAVICAWLGFYYGNWVFSDSDILKYNIIGSSYTRYWLPVYICLLPLIGYAYKQFHRLKINKVLKFIVVAFVICGLSYFSYSWAVKSQRDGLRALGNTLQSYYQRYEKVDSLIEKNAILITDRSDKIFFPQYQVIVFWWNYDIFTSVKKLADDQPVYYFSLMPEAQVDQLNQDYLNELDMFFSQPQIIDSEFSLYKLTKK